MASRKRREAFGKLRKLPSGRYQASYVGLDGVRYPASSTFDNATDARGWLALQRVALDSGNWSPADAARTAGRTKARADTLGDFAQDWLRTRVNRHGEGLRPRTRVEYQRLLSGPLAPLAAERVAMITPDMVRSWYAAQLESGTKTQTARAYGLLKSVLATAVQDGRIVTNPCMIRGAQNATTGKKVEPPTAAELQKILDSITPRYRAAVLLAAWAGTRFGELTELRRKDIKIIKNGPEVETIIVDVSRAVTHTTGVGFTVGPTKSAAGVRAIALPRHIHPDVLGHLRDNVGDFPDSLLFPARDGHSHLAESSFVKHWYPARAAAKRTDMPFHALRHYGATRFAQTGATLKEIQDRLGHSTAAAAMRYQHSAGRDIELANRMSDLA
ncbi:tyrosine-type recombinase/integrase [Diaminobutyricibacter tongyongensis]|uniref:Tyrosine-type recombinase/integrase n=1 Tax=Leifsonia tongyongensis TaxID=1268043 RepID=A0A6L9XY21_9MICO|nr:tyrosine-type recombinase/integrase [Diaminobutyricibacter tongyongensis]NEN06329.1 tyrosine-type recombinase/integrase [Diaminobutyricibacter tongyongensis]